MFAKKPPEHKIVHKWDPTKVLFHFRSWKPAHLLSLRNLAAKTIFLIALATGCRLKELRSLRLDRLVKTEREWIFTLTSTKIYNSKHPNPELLSISIQKNVYESDLCPIHNLEVYIEKTESIRNTPVVFVSTKKPYSPYQSITVSNFIREILVKAGVASSNKKGLTQKVRSAVASSLYDAGVPVSSILKNCHWQSGASFYTYYYKQNPNTTYATFRQNRTRLSQALTTKPSSTTVPFDAVTTSFSKNNPRPIQEEPLQEELLLQETPQDQVLQEQVSSVQEVEQIITTDTCYPSVEVSSPQIAELQSTPPPSPREDQISNLYHYPQSLYRAIKRRKKYSLKKLRRKRPLKSDSVSTKHTVLLGPFLPDTSDPAQQQKDVVQESLFIHKSPVYEISFQENIVQNIFPICSISISPEIEEPLSFAARNSVWIRTDSAPTFYCAELHASLANLSLNSFLRTCTDLPPLIDSAFAVMREVKPSQEILIDVSSSQVVLIPLNKIPISLLPLLVILVNEHNVNLLNIPNQGSKAVFLTYMDTHVVFLCSFNKFHWG